MTQGWPWWLVTLAALANGGAVLGALVAIWALWKEGW